jgi:hypothetical protein
VEARNSCKASSETMLCVVPMMVIPGIAPE